MPGTHACVRTLLIANRGEIAVRIARGARELGISPVGVYSDADEDAAFRDALDASVRIGPGPAAESYLNATAILDAARALGADAVHPGYGFLSERAPFAQAVLDAGLTFVGPPPAALAAMGAKDDAKRRARAAGVPVVAGYDGDDQSDATLRREANSLGVPLLIKASAGGGGRGMRVVSDLAQFDELLTAARREAAASFGDDRVLLERYLTHPRHVEIQILADTHGNVVHLGERECSIQRRHQKVLEESPSSAVDAALRERMGATAVAAARAVGYTNAGTVEFLLDADGTFAFLEMNARLQVEHPITELTYGVDLVHEQLRVASGEKLRFTQGDLRPRGWSIEVRLCAEDPAHDYAPQAGTIAVFDVPSMPGVRVDSGIRNGSEASPFYDSLLAKIIVWGEDRPTAIARLANALDETRIVGIATNLPLLRALARDEAFRRGDTSTRFLEERAAQLPLADDPERRRRAALVAACALASSGFGWRPGGIGTPIALQVDGTTLRAAGEAARVPDGIAVSVDGHGYVFRFAAPPLALRRDGRAGSAGGEVVSPMPGRIVSVPVEIGATVASGDLVVVLEAMKMEHRIEAPRSGTIVAVNAAAGDIVAANAPLVTIGDAAS
jgi:3-methylcrotonyl-CoA carboxylase alpha subunit